MSALPGLAGACARQRQRPACGAHTTPAAQAISSTFLLSGWEPGSSSSIGDEGPKHVVRVVAASDLEPAKAALQAVTSLHVYSVQPTTVKVRSRCQGTISG